MNVIIGPALRQVRTAAGLDIYAAALICETSPAYLSRVEKGETRPAARWAEHVMRVLAGQVVAP